MANQADAQTSLDLFATLEANQADVLTALESKDNQADVLTALVRVATLKAVTGVLPVLPRRKRGVRNPPAPLIVSVFDRSLHSSRMKC
mmetsp:Transcript_11001/g.15858  ORF Transcript_11001/g.15858 Transcript_11001/m.15858 type:complete len:88 (-) Transcript_11001:69-332(-)